MICCPAVTLQGRSTSSNIWRKIGQLRKGEQWDLVTYDQIAGTGLDPMVKVVIRTSSDLIQFRMRVSEPDLPRIRQLLVAIAEASKFRKCMCFQRWRDCSVRFLLVQGTNLTLHVENPLRRMQHLQPLVYVVFSFCFLINLCCFALIHRRFDIQPASSDQPSNAFRKANDQNLPPASTPPSMSPCRMLCCCFWHVVYPFVFVVMLLQGSVSGRAQNFINASQPARPAPSSSAPFAVPLIKQPESGPRLTGALQDKRDNEPIEDSDDDFMQNRPSNVPWQPDLSHPSFSTSSSFSSSTAASFSHDPQYSSKLGRQMASLSQHPLPSPFSRSVSPSQSHSSSTSHFHSISQGSKVAAASSKLNTASQKQRVLSSTAHSLLSPSSSSSTCSCCGKQSTLKFASFSAFFIFSFFLVSFFRAFFGYSSSASSSPSPSSRAGVVGKERHEGLKNLGNNCYMNAVLHSLFSLKPFMKSLRASYIQALLVEGTFLK